MTNPVSQSPSAQLPLYGAQLIDPNTGNATTLFHRFLAGLYLRTGGATGSDAGDVAQVADNALATATEAVQSAALAQTTASAAQSVADTAQTAAADAQAGVTSCVTTIQALRVSSLQTQNNLADVASRVTSRQNLGVNVFPLSVAFDGKPSAGLNRYVPIVMGMQIPANFHNTIVFWQTNATADAVFTIKYIRNTVTNVVGTILIINGGGVILSPFAAVNLVAGDVLVIQCPSPADATLANIGITFPLSLT